MRDCLVHHSKFGRRERFGMTQSAGAWRRSCPFGGANHYVSVLLLYLGAFNDVSPAHLLRRDIGTKFCRRLRNGRCPGPCEVFFEGWISQRYYHGLIESGDYGLWCARRRKQAESVVRNDICKTLLDRRGDVWRGARALSAIDSQGDDGTGLDVRQIGRNIRNKKLHPSGQQVRHRRRPARIRDMDEINTCDLLHEFACQMRNASSPGRCIAQLAGTRFGGGDELRERL